MVSGMELMRWAIGPPFLLSIGLPEGVGGVAKVGVFGDAVGKTY
jgi:hypothetical protein